MERNWKRQNVKKKETRQQSGSTGHIRYRQTFPLRLHVFTECAPLRQNHHSVTTLETVLWGGGSAFAWLVHGPSLQMTEKAVFLSDWVFCNGPFQPSINFLNPGIHATFNCQWTSWFLSPSGWDTRTKALWENVLGKGTAWQMKHFLFVVNQCLAKNRVHLFIRHHQQHSHVSGGPLSPFDSFK